MKVSTVVSIDKDKTKRPGHESLGHSEAYWNQIRPALKGQCYILRKFGDPFLHHWQFRTNREKISHRN